MKRINFEDGELVKGAYVTINDEEVPVTEAEYIGDTPLSSYVMNKLQDNIEEELNSGKTIQGEQIIIENACRSNADVKICGKTIQEGNIIKNIENLNFTKQNEDGSISETINFPLSEGQILHEGDYIDKEGIHVSNTLQAFTESQQTAYNQLRLMYEGYNKIVCTDEVKPELDVTYYYNNDLNKTYAKRMDKTEKEVGKLKMRREFKSIAIPTNSNLNDYTEEGMYYCGATATANTISNKPYNDAFSLLVEKHAGCKQTFTIFYANSPRTWIRNYYNGAWGTWQEVFKKYISTGTEYETGRIIDGKVEYGKRILTGNLTSGGEKTISTGLSNITQQRPIIGVVKATGQANIDIPNSANSIRIYTRLSSNGANLTIGNAGDLTAFSGFIDLYYTKN